MVKLAHQSRIHADIKTPPHSIESEQAVLGGCLMSDDAYWQISGIVKQEDFYRQDHRLLFGAIQALAEQDQPRDVVTMSEWLDRRGELEKAGGLLYLGTLVKDTPSAANVEAYAKIMAEYAQARRAIAVMDEAVSVLYRHQQDPAEVIAGVQAQLESTATGLHKEMSFLDILRKGIDMITRNRERRLEGKLAGVSYTLKEIDERTGGMRKAQLIAIAGRPSLGKTAFAHQIALEAAQAGIPAGEISLEMSAEQLAIRSLANRFSVNGTGLMLGYDDPIQGVTDGLAMSPEFRNIPLHIDTDTYQFHAIVSRIVEWKRKHNIQFVIIDHIGLITCSDYDKKIDRLGFITNSLKRLAKRLDMPIVILCQLNRSTEKDKRRPVLSDFRDCGEIEQDIDVGIFLHSEGDDEEKEIDVEFGLLKNRDGMRGWLPEEIKFRFRKSIQRFVQI